jgi:hypothetical protein
MGWLLATTTTTWWMAKRRIILAALVTPADVMENVPLRDLLWRVCFQRKLHPRQAIGDTTYGTVENIVALEDEGIRADVALPDMNHRGPFYDQDSFRYDPARDEYPCSAGHALARERVKPTEGAVVHRADAATCNACPLKAERTESRRGRIPHRSLYADYLEKVRGYHTTEAYKIVLRKRQVWVEPLFTEAKLWHGLRCFRRRRLANVNIEGLLIAGGAEPQTLAGRHWVGPLWEPGRFANGVTEAFSRIQVTISTTRTRANPVSRTHGGTHHWPHQSPFSTACSLLRPVGFELIGQAGG